MKSAAIVFGIPVACLAIFFGGIWTGKQHERDLQRAKEYYREATGREWGNPPMSDELRSHLMMSNFFYSIISEAIKPKP